MASVQELPTSIEADVRVCRSMGSRRRVQNGLPKELSGETKGVPTDRQDREDASNVNAPAYLLFLQNLQFNVQTNSEAFELS